MTKKKCTSFPYELRRLREERKLSQREAAEACTLVRRSRRRTTSTDVM
jgi:transcriptional regulator with XRE-family HTH domain